MCGRFSQGRIEDDLQDLFDLSDTGNLPALPAKYNGAPTQNFITCRHDKNGQRSLAHLTWGLVPFWSRDRSIGNRLINARSETVDQKPSFRQAFRQRRCLIPANGWFEWQRKEGGKQPYFIQLQGGSPLVMAGIWENWTGEDGILETFSLLTRDACPDLRSIHHRQPVVVDRNDFDTWLYPDSSKTELQAVIEAPSPTFEAWPVSTLVNNARNNVPEIMFPL